MNLLNNKARIKAQSEVYLKQLKIRQEEKTQNRANFLSIRRQLNIVNQELSKDINRIEKYLLKREGLVDKIKFEAKKLSGVIEDQGKESKALEEIISASYEEYTPESANNWSAVLRNEISTKYKRIFTLLESVDNEKYEREDIFNLSKISGQLDAILNGLMKSQKSYLSSGGSESLINELSEINFDDFNGQDEIENFKNEIKKSHKIVQMKKLQLIQM